MCVGIGTAIGVGVSALSSLASGAQQSAAAKANARFIQRQAELERTRNQFEQQKSRRQEARIVGQQSASFAKAGVAPDSGSVQDVIGDTLTETGLDQAAINFGGQVTDQNLRTRAQISRNRGKSAFTSGIFNAFGSVIGSKGVQNSISRGFGNATLLQSPFTRAF